MGSGTLILMALAGWINRQQQEVNLNAFAERSVRPIKSEGLDQLILVGERSLRGAVDGFCAHYHEERNHQGLDNKLIEADFAAAEAGELKCRERLGGLLRYYHREAA